MPIVATVVLAAAMASGAGSETDAQFQAKVSQAQKNAASGKGKAFDQAIADALGKNKEFSASVSACLRKFPGDQVVLGYMEFTTATSHRVVLHPESGFASCFGDVVSRQTLPAPPRLPYLNPVDFTNHPGKPVVQKIEVTKDMLRELDGSPFKTDAKPAKPTAAKPMAAPAATPATKP